MSAQLPPIQSETPASAATSGNASAIPEPGTPTRATSPRPQGLDPSLQSQLDKRDQRITTEIQRLAALIEKLQAPPAPAASTETAATPPPAPPSQPVAPASATAAEASPSPVLAAAAERPYNEAELKAYGVMDAEGVDIDSSDPESKLIDWSDPIKAARTTKAAIEAKKTRTANAALPVSGGVAATNPIASITDREKLWEMAKKAW